MGARTAKRPKPQKVAYDIAEIIETEEALIGSLAASMRRGDIEVVATTIQKNDFVGDPTLGEVLDEMIAMHEAGEPVGDIIAVRRRLLARGLYDRMGGPKRMASMIEKASTNPVHYANLVRTNAVRVRASAEARRLAEMLEDLSQDPFTVGQDCLDRMEEMLTRSTTGFSFVGDVAAEIVEDLKRARKPPMIYTGLPKFDHHIGGMAAGELIVLCARPSVGKSALASQIAEHNAQHGRPGLIVSLEMRNFDFVSRLLAKRSQVPLKTLRNGQLQLGQQADLEVAANDLKELPLSVSFMGSAKMTDIRRKARAFRATHGLSLLVIDYLQIIGRADHVENRRESITDATKQCKELAGELGCPVLLLSQLNRESTKMDRPSLTNLSESSSIEADADMVLAIHTTALEEKNRQLLILKNRNGETMDMKDFQWNGESMTYSFEREF